MTSTEYWWIPDEHPIFYSSELLTYSLYLVRFHFFIPFLNYILYSTFLLCSFSFQSIHTVMNRKDHKFIILVNILISSNRSRLILFKKIVIIIPYPKWAKLLIGKLSPPSFISLVLWFFFVTSIKQIPLWRQKN